MALIDDFKARFPQFDSTTVDSLFPSIEAVYPCLYGFAYGAANCNDQAVLYLCAHLFILNENMTNGNDSASRLEQSKSVGSVSVSYSIDPNSLTLNRQLLGTTVYGQIFLRLTSSRQGAMFV